MKTPRPGQFCNIDGVFYRAKKRTNGCKGCALYDILLCPNVVDKRTHSQTLECSMEDIILIRI